jgi:hypothetical protein
MTKKQLVEDIKRISKATNAEVIFFYYKGENVASLEIPIKHDYQTMEHYMKQFDISYKGKGVYLFTVKFAYMGSLSVLIDNYGGYKND